ncbi:MAG: NUDIX domain-containing protein [Bacteroidetes bacterium]|nr:NUDIX domain-containing protein [Bacteroidota bacterium]
MHQNYKIFSRDLEFIIGSLETVDSFPDFSPQPASLQALRKLLEKKSSHKKVFLTTENPSDFFASLKKEFAFVPAAGGIVWNENHELLMIFRRGKWDLPKGKIEKGEATDLAAIREVEEETGATDLSIKNFFAETYHIFKQDSVWMLKQTSWFEMNCPTQKLNAQAEEDITEAVWVSRKLVKERLRNSYPNVVDLVVSVL